MQNVIVLRVALNIHYKLKALVITFYFQGKKGFE